jgi:hypothetical protein
MTQVNKNEDLSKYLTRQPPKVEPKPKPEPKENSRHWERSFFETFSKEDK